MKVVSSYLLTASTCYVKYVNYINGLKSFLGFRRYRPETSDGAVLKNRHHKPGHRFLPKKKNKGSGT